MEATTTVTAMDTTNEENNTTRQSSKLSLGSSPSVLSADEQLEGDGPLTPTDKIEDDDDMDEDGDDDDLSALNSILQAGSPGSLSNEEVSDDDTEQDSASPLSSVPDDFPLSRSASPEFSLVEPLSTSTSTTNNTTTTTAKATAASATVEEEEEEEEEEEVKKPSTRKRRKENNKSENGPSTKKAKQDGASATITTSTNTTASPSQSTQTQQPLPEERKRRASRSITNNIIIEPLSTNRPRRRQSRQDELSKKETQETEQNKLVEEDEEDEDDDEGEETETMEEDKTSSKAKAEEETKVETEREEKKKSKVKDDSDAKSVEHDKEEEEEEEEENKPSENQSSGESEEQKSNSNTNHVDTQDNDDHDYQQRHKEALDALTHIEVEFARLRDKMYEEKMSELNEEAIMIANGTHPELVTLMAEIEEKKGKRIHSAEAWRRHQHANFKQQFEGFEYQANIHFISQKNALRRSLLSSIHGKRWNIEDERSKLNDVARTDRVFPDGREMASHKREQKDETGELQDIKEAIGFPMAPNPTGLSIQDVDDDLKLLGIHRNNNNNNL